MNVQSPIRRPEPIKLTAAGFWMLKQAGAFADFSKAELLEGEISGVPRQSDDEPESDSSVPIKLKLDDYASLAEAGMFQLYGKTELIDGVVYEVSPQYRPHGFVKDELAYRLRRALEAIGSPLHVATEQSVAIAPHSEPQPDIVLTSEPRGAGPIPVASVALVVEISASTLRFDLTEKAEIYATAGVPEYWVVDVNSKTVHQAWSPEGETYAERREVAFGQPIRTAAIDLFMIETVGL